METTKKPNMGISSLLFAALLSKQSGEDKKIRGTAFIGYNTIHIPRRAKFKGWMREDRKCSFNKNK